MKNSAIEWTDHTFNPWIGCTKVSPGCANCYAETLMDTRMGRVRWGKGKPRQRTSEAYWQQPLQWNRKAALFLQCKRGCRFQSTDAGLDGFCPRCGDPEADPVRPRVFCASLADWLDDEVPLEWLADLLGLIAQTPNLDWLLLTKRPELWRHRIREVAESGFPGELARRGMHFAEDWFWDRRCSPENVWIGTSVEDQVRAQERIPYLLRIPARVRFLSMEPLLGPVDLGISPPRGHTAETYHAGIHWVIVGGESGAEARPMHPVWARKIRDECAAAGVPLFFKQWGEHDERTIRMGKKLAGRLLDGVEHNALPR